MNAESRTVAIEKLRCASDARGFVFEPLGAAGLVAQRNVHVVMTEPRQIRGNHFHLEGREITVVAGPVLVRYRDQDDVMSVEVPLGEIWRFTFPARVTHAFQNLSSSANVIVSFNSLPHDPSNPDTIRDVILE